MQGNVFDVDLKSMSSIEIRRWLKDCRNLIKSTDYEHRADYLQAVKNFTDDWYQHYLDNQKIYGDYKFKRALLSLALPELVIKTIIDGKKVIVPPMKFETIQNHNPFAKTLEQEEDEHIKDNIKNYYEEISKCFKANNLENYKSDLDRIIRECLIDSVSFQLKVYQGKKVIKFNSFDELIKEIENLGNYRTETKSTPKLLTPTKCIKTGYQNLLLQNGISKTVYNDFQSEDFCEQDFGKKMFVNIGFMLELPFDMLNTLLSFNGYSIDKSGKVFDKIVDRAFKIGFGRKLTIDLIDYYNGKLLEKYGTIINKKGKEEDNFAKITNLNSMKD